MSDIESLKGSIPLYSPKYLQGIDALYFQVKINYDDYTLFYNNVLLSGTLENDDNFSMCSYDYTKQYTFFTYRSEGSSPIQLCRIGFKNLNQKDYLESILIQMDSMALNVYGYKESYSLALDLIRSLGLQPLSTKVSRVDLNTYVTDHDFTYLDFNLFSTKQSKNGKITSSLSSRDKLETFYLGSRDSKSIHLRIYNKLVELYNMSKSDYSLSSNKQMIIDMRFAEKYHTSVDYKHLWNVEFELKRELLKRYNIDSVDDLFLKINDLHYDICTNHIRLLEREKDIINNSRIDSSLVWNDITNNYKVFVDEIKPIDKNKLKVYKKDNIWLLNRLNEYLLENPLADEEMISNINSLRASLV